MPTSVRKPSNTFVRVLNLPTRRVCAKIVFFFAINPSRTTKNQWRRHMASLQGPARRGEPGAAARADPGAVSESGVGHPSRLAQEGGSSEKQVQLLALVLLVVIILEVAMCVCLAGRVLCRAVRGKSVCTYVLCNRSGAIVLFSSMMVRRKCAASE